MPWTGRVKARREPARTLAELSTDIRVLRSTIAAQASSIATLATSLTRLDGRVEALAATLTPRPGASAGGKERTG